MNLKDNDKNIIKYDADKISITDFKNYEYTFLSQKRNKKDFITCLPEWLQNLKKDHVIYFVTFTFNDLKSSNSKDIYKDYFERFYRRLNQYCCHRKDYFKSCKMLLIPEASYHSVKSNRYQCNHFHGFIAVHKDRNDKFIKKCVKEICAADTPEGLKQDYKLVENLINPYPAEIISNAQIDFENPILKISETRIYRLESDEDLTRVSFYNTKSLLTADNGYEDILMFAKSKPNKTIH